MKIIITGNLTKEYPKKHFFAWLTIGLSQAFDGKFEIKVEDEEGE